MYGWFVDVAGPTLGAALFWFFAALVLIALFLGVYSLFRRAASTSFLTSGRNRKPRLAVVDVTAVDSRRRLVLVRRDESEHLILIGGPSDLVVESGIRRKAEERRVAPEFAEPPIERPRRAPPVAVPAADPSPAQAEAPALAPQTVVPEPELAPEPSIVNEPVIVQDAAVLPEPMQEPVRKHSLLDPEIGPAIRQEPAMPVRQEPPLRQETFAQVSLEPQLPERQEPARAAPPVASVSATGSAAGRVEPSLDVPGQPAQAEPALDFDAALLRELETDIGGQPRSPESNPPRQEAPQPKPEETLSSIFADIVRRHRS